MNVSCQCGAIKFLTPTTKPNAIYICHCDDCRRQSSSAFGASAIFPAFEIPLVDLMGAWIRKTTTGSIHCYFCKTCGTRLIHAQAGKETMSIKGGCIADLDWVSAKHIWAQKAVLPLHESITSIPGAPTNPKSNAKPNKSHSNSKGRPLALIKVGESAHEKGIDTVNTTLVSTPNLTSNAATDNKALIVTNPGGAEDKALVISKEMNGTGESEEMGTGVGEATGEKKEKEKKKKRRRSAIRELFGGSAKEKA